MIGSQLNAQNLLGDTTFLLLGQPLKTSGDSKGESANVRETALYYSCHLLDFTSMSIQSQMLKQLKEHNNHEKAIQKVRIYWWLLKIHLLWLIPIINLSLAVGVVCALYDWSETGVTLYKDYTREMWHSWVSQLKKKVWHFGKWADLFSCQNKFPSVKYKTQICWFYTSIKQTKDGLSWNRPFYNVNRILEGLTSPMCVFFFLYSSYSKIRGGEMIKCD